MCARPSRALIGCDGRWHQKILCGRKIVRVRTDPLRTSTALCGIASDASAQPSAGSGRPGGPEHLPEGTGVVIALREPPGLLSRHPASDQGLTESLDALFPALLESEEPHAKADGHDGDRRDQDDWQAGVVAGHQSPPSPRRPTAFAMIPPRFREDMYCSERLNACSSDIPLFLSVV